MRVRVAVPIRKPIPIPMPTPIRYRIRYRMRARIRYPIPYPIRATISGAMSAPRLGSHAFDDVDHVVYETASVRVGAFRCPTHHPSFRDSGPIREHCFVFPRTPVVIRHKDSRPFAADPTLVALYNRGQEYSRERVSPDG